MTGLLRAVELFLARRRVAGGYCPVCNSSPPREQCPVCRGSYDYGPDLEQAVRVTWWERYLALPPHRRRR